MQEKILATESNMSGMATGRQNIFVEEYEDTHRIYEYYRNVDVLWLTVYVGVIGLTGFIIK